MVALQATEWNLFLSSQIWVELENGRSVGYASHKGQLPPPKEDAEAQPDLFTAIQQQLGLKLEAVKTAVDVLVIDHVEKPSAN